MIYDRDRAARMLKVVIDVTAGAIDLSTRPGGDPGVRPPALAAEKVMRSLAAKGDCEGMYQEYLKLLHDAEHLGRPLDRAHQKSFESELYRFVQAYWEKE
ncbi:MAG TPA: hypothetical protein VGS03_18405 [Candidatus Polarisedimenticolia bacterium]|jgi:hypothetical protein|nr:hypothetical protein [Candidatus Polarisedimenticolia bacterium]